MRIMIVEDDPGAAQMMEEALNGAGHQANSYGHGALALGAIVRGNYELLICDLMLPNYNGVDLITMIRRQLPHLPVIVVSALDPAEWEVLCRKAGATCFIRKPLRLERLMQEVKLVQDSQAKLDIGIVDGDESHVAQLSRELVSLGCQVSRWGSVAEMRAEPAHAGAQTVLLVDAGMVQAADAIGWAAKKGLAVVAFQAEGPGFDQDGLMRMGASFCLTKPVDPVSLVTQARFFVSPQQPRLGE